MSELRAFLHTSSNRGFYAICRKAGVRLIRPRNFRYNRLTAAEVARVLELWHATRTRWRTRNRRRAH